MTTAETIRTAATEEAVKAALLGSGRVRDMAEAYKEVTGKAYAGRMSGIKKEEVASKMAKEIMEERFNALSGEEKYAELRGQKDMLKVHAELLRMSNETLKEVALFAGLEESETPSRWEIEKKLVEHFRSELAKDTLDAVKRAGSRAEAREILKGSLSTTLERVCELAGKDFQERCEDARSNGIEEDDLKDWAIEWVLEKLGIEECTEMETVNATEAVEETPAEEMSVKAEIAFPLEGHTAESLKNVVNTLYARGSLMSKATGGDFCVSEKLVEELKEYGTTVEEVLRIIRSAGEEWLHGLAFEEDKVVFTGFPATDDAVKTHAYILLATAINKASIEQKRIQAKKVDESNEKFAFRVWLVRLGLNGSEAKAERKALYANLTGHTAFRTKEDEEKWYARRRATASTGNTDAE